MFDITQAYGQYASGDLTLMAGKFTTLAGTEVIASPGNMNFSRSMLFGAVPFTHTGVRAGYAVSSIVTLYGGLNNGWDQLTDANKGKTLELGASIVPIKPLTINVTGYFGKESAVAPGTQPAAAQDQRQLLDVVVTWTINNNMSAGGEILYVSQDRPTGGRRSTTASQATSLTTSAGSGVSRRVRSCSTTRTAFTSRLAPLLRPVIRSTTR